MGAGGIDLAYHSDISRTGKLDRCPQACKPGADNHNIMIKLHVNSPDTDVKLFLLP
jgi:hypothetical protein